MVFPKGMSAGQKNALLRLKRLLEKEGAAGVGETAVVSLKVHVQDVSNPDEVAAVVTTDAGRVFYNREHPGEILHIDVFHSPGRLDPKFVGRRLLSSLSGIRFEPAPGVLPGGLEPLLSYIDIQTASGGGRLDGDLVYGQEEGVRRAHTTHVHIACLMMPEIMASVFSIVAAVESAAVEAGLELRKLRRVRLTRGGGVVDMTDYQASGDSLLRNAPPQGQENPADLYRREALARRVAHDIGSASDSAKLLEGLARGLRSGDFATLRLSTDKSPDEIRKIVTGSGLAMYDGHKYTLTQEGMMALSFLKAHSSEIEAYLRRLLWSLPSRKMPAGERKGLRPEPSISRGRGIVLPAVKGERLPSLAIPETITAWKNRTIPSTSNDPPQAGPAARSGLLPGSPVWSDLRFAYSRERKGMPIILLIDASASMAGRRIRAAKELARHLVLAGKEKVSIVTFQDSDVKVVAGFTRNRRKIEEGLAEVHALGLTPLAKGLEKALELSVRSSRKPLILAITDGIPTVPSKSLSPVQDALDSAKMIARRGVRFGCVGLEPNRGFLKQMVANAKGTLYIVEELEASTLAAIAKRESLR
jgi:magnesium chelatase subunit D